MGLFVGTYRGFDASYAYHQYAYVSDGNVFQALAAPPHAQDYGATSPVGINNLGAVSGSYFDDSGNGHGFIYSGGSYTVLDHPALAGPFGSVWNTAAGGNNDAGAVAGCFSTADASGQSSYGYVYSGGSYTDLSVAGQRATCAEDINNSGVVVGEYLDNTGPWGNHHGFVYDHGNYALLDDSAFPGGSVDTYLTGINDKGQITGYYYDADFNAWSFVATPSDAPGHLPEPAGLALPGLALAALVTRSTRTRRRR